MATIAVAALVPFGGRAVIDRPATSIPRGAHFLREGPGLSKNWSGYLVTGASFRHVSAHWRIPRVACRSGRPGYSAMWIGLGGYRGAGLEQVGTESDCPGGRRPVTYAWYELLPFPLHGIRLRVSQGDRISASVTVAGAWTTIRMRDLDRRGSFHRRLYTSEVNLSSAEWILEAPSVCVPFSDNCLIRPLLSFGRAGFSSAQVTTVDSFRGTIGNRAWQRLRIVLVQERLLGGGRYLVRGASPSGLRARGGSFSVSYKERTVRLGRRVPSGAAACPATAPEDDVPRSRHIRRPLGTSAFRPRTAPPCRTASRRPPSRRARGWRRS